MGEARILLIAAKTNPIAHRALGIDVDNQSLEPAPRKCRGEVHRGCGLSYSAFLTDDREDIAHLLGDLRVFAAPNRAAFRSCWRCANPLERLFCVPHPTLG